LKKQPNSQVKENSKRKHETQLSKAENKKVKLQEPASEEGMKKQILL
jgi:hypothetical protein